MVNYQTLKEKWVPKSDIKKVSVYYCHVLPQIESMVSASISFNTFKYHVFAPMGRFQLELIYLYFPPSFHKQLLFLSRRPFVVNITFSTDLVGVDNCQLPKPGQK